MHLAVGPQALSDRLRLLTPHCFSLSKLVGLSDCRLEASEPSQDVFQNLQYNISFNDFTAKELLMAVVFEDRLNIRQTVV